MRRSYSWSQTSQLINALGNDSFRLVSQRCHEFADRSRNVRFYSFELIALSKHQSVRVNRSCAVTYLKQVRKQGTVVVTSTWKLINGLHALVNRSWKVLRVLWHVVTDNLKVCNDNVHWITKNSRKGCELVWMLRQLRHVLLDCVDVLCRGLSHLFQQSVDGI